MPVAPIIIASEPSNVFRALLHPEDLKAWWACTVVADARAGGIWVGGWGEDGDGLGHATVLSAQITRLETNKLVALKIGEIEIVFHFDAVPQGTAVRVEQPGAEGPAADESTKSWLAAVESMKAWVEQAHPYTPPIQAAAPAASAPAQAPDPAAGVQGVAGADPYKISGLDGVTVIDEGGFGVTDPNAVIKSWSKEQGFGYATHPLLGDVSFDYDGCDFEPATGDKVLLLVIGKRYDGKPKIKRIACPAKGSNIH